jgi:hypothetical protein
MRQSPYLLKVLLSKVKIGEFIQTEEIAINL